ncbi:MAG: succinate dehydrogenase, hydrophobic membrane anchor protein [Rhodocyclaceae bacterium]|nr:succinate dehydrogenase, hydrophobic membrane anchor protein [Rhodocyclaceae bacterium]
MVNRIVVGAHYGIKDWLAQRITGVVMAAYSLYFLGALLGLGEVNYDSWHALFASGITRVFTLIFFLSLFYHAWVGVRDIFMDYIKPTGLRLALHALVILALIGYAAWVAQVLWRL